MSVDNTSILKTYPIPPERALRVLSAAPLTARDPREDYAK
jgi:hypothetical protein